MTSNRRNFIRALAGAALVSPWTPARAETAKKNMIVRSARPEDFEMPLDGFGEWLTPIERFFVRSHHYTPKVDLQSWKLTISGEVNSPVTLTMEDLKRMPRTEVVSVLECAGNGRGLYEPPVTGVQWAYGAVGNGRWTGVRLSTLLEKAGLKESARHVLFDGADVPVGTMPEFKRTVPVKKSLAQDTILAYEMNGQTMPVSHGFPLRLVVPGWAGDSWVKWLTAITVLDSEFDGFFMKTAYRHPGRAVEPGSAVDPAQMHPVESLSVKATIAAPADESVLSLGPARIHGVAWSGEQPVTRVQVSTDRGRTWQNAKLGGESTRYGWRLWEATWTPKTPGHFIVMARAEDKAGNLQPMYQEWNPSGYLNNTVHAVTVRVAAEGTREAPVPAEPKAGKIGGFEQPKGYGPACLTCHGEDIIMQQRLTRVQWEREVDKMVRWGAKVNPADREPIIDYLLKLYGPRPGK